MEIVISQNKTDLERLEGIISRNLQSFYEVGRALMEIRDKGLYRDVLGYQTKALCKIADENGIEGMVSLDVEKFRSKSGSVSTGVTAWVDHELFGGRSFGAVLKQVKEYARKEPL